MLVGVRLACFRVGCRAAGPPSPVSLNACADITHTARSLVHQVGRAPGSFQLLAAFALLLVLCPLSRSCAHRPVGDSLRLPPLRSQRGPRKALWHGGW